MSTEVDTNAETDMDMIALKMRLSLLKRERENGTTDEHLAKCIEVLEHQVERATAFLKQRRELANSTVPFISKFPLKSISPGDRIVISGSNLMINYFLNGRTWIGDVGLAPSMDPPFGTRWEVLDAGVAFPEPGTPSILPQYHAAYLRCLENPQGPSQFLDGNCDTGAVRLSHTTAWPYSGTKWLIGTGYSDGSHGSTLSLRNLGVGTENNFWDLVIRGGKVVLDVNPYPRKLADWWWTKV